MTTAKKTYLDCIAKLIDESTAHDFRLNDKLLLEFGELAPMEFDGNDTDYLIWESDRLTEHLQDTSDPTIWSLLIHQLESRDTRPVLMKMAAAIVADDKAEPPHPRVVAIDRVEEKERIRSNKRFTDAISGIHFKLSQMQDEHLQRDDDHEVAA